jgi:hypothetical protein
MNKLSQDWIVGFVDGEGCFHVGINTNKEMSLGVQVLPEFVVVQHKRDVEILYKIKTFFNCGVVRKNHGDRMCYRVRKMSDFSKIIIPFFEKYKLKTSKKANFLRFRWVIKVMLEKRYHLSPEGLHKIKLVQKRMNRGYKIESSSD